VSTESPEAFEEVFWMTFDEGDKDTKEKFKNYVQLINHKYQKKRYLSKNNQNIRRLELISKIFPHSKILFLLETQFNMHILYYLNTKDLLKIQRKISLFLNI